MTFINRRDVVKNGSTVIVSAAVCAAVPTLARAAISDEDRALSAWREYVTAAIEDNAAYDAYDEARVAAHREAGKPWEYVNVGTAGVYLRRGPALGGPSELIRTLGSIEELYVKGRALRRRRNRQIRAAYREACKLHRVLALKRASDRALQRREDAEQAITNLPPSPIAALMKLSLWVLANTAPQQLERSHDRDERAVLEAYSTLRDVTGLDPVKGAYISGWA